jgi:hypothetical protein
LVPGVYKCDMTNIRPDEAAASTPLR